MKNIHVLPTDKPSRLIIYSTLLNEFRLLASPIEDWKHKRNIYITSDKEIKEGDYYITVLDNKVFKADSNTVRIMNDANKSSNTTYKNTHFKIILTTDQDLIADGVQAIDDEFLEWFVKNPSCEEVEVESFIRYNPIVYQIILPKPKQETLEEAAENFVNSTRLRNYKVLFIEGAKWQAKRMYSEEEVLDLLAGFADSRGKDFIPYKDIQEWFEQFKKKQ